MNNIIHALETKARIQNKGRLSFRSFIWIYFKVNPFEFDYMTDLNFKKWLVKEYEIYIERNDY